MVEQDIRTWLIANTSLESAQVHFTRALQGTSPPYAVISRVSGTWYDTHDGPTGTADGVWQVSIFGKTLGQVKAISADVYGLHGAGVNNTGRIQQVSETDLYEQDAGMYQIAHRFLVQYYV